MSARNSSAVSARAALHVEENEGVEQRAEHEVQRMLDVAPGSPSASRAARSPAARSGASPPSRSPVTTRYAACCSSTGVSSIRPTITASKRNPPAKKAMDSARACRARKARIRARSPVGPGPASTRVSSGVAVVPPGMGSVAVAAGLPEAGSVMGEELDALDPLGALPSVQLRRDHPHRPAVLARQRLALRGVDEEHVVLQRLLQRQVGGVAVVPVDQDVGRGGQRARQRGDWWRRPLPSTRRRASTRW